MPLLLIGSGVALMFVGINGNVAQLYTLLAHDFTGPKNFIYWFLSICVLGALGYIKGLENLSKLFLILVILTLVLENGGVFQQFQSFINSLQSTTGASNSQSSSAAPSSTPSSGASSSGISQLGSL